MNPLSKFYLSLRLGKIKWPSPYVYLVDDIKLAYIQIPKVASRSIRTVLAGHILNQEPGALETGLVRKVEEENCRFFDKNDLLKLNDDYFTFSFVRHPVSRLYSCYRNKLDSQSGLKKPSLYFKKYGLIPGISFEEFANRVCEIPDDLSDRHFRSQSSFLCFQGSVIPSFVGKLETINADWAEVSKKTGLGSLPQKNTTGGSKHLDISPDLRNKIYRRYEEDFCAFEYSVNKD
jgi:hypothetical protein